MRASLRLSRVAADLLETYVYTQRTSHDRHLISTCCPLPIRLAISPNIAHRGREVSLRLVSTEDKGRTGTWIGSGHRRPFPFVRTGHSGIYKKGVVVDVYKEHSTFYCKNDLRGKEGFDWYFHYHYYNPFPIAPRKADAVTGTKRRFKQRIVSLPGTLFTKSTEVRL